MDAKLCPCDPNLVAFIHRNDIWINNIVTEEERRLTYTNQGTPSPMEEPVSAGVASFIVQEEFERYTGYWWQPKFSTDESMYHKNHSLRSKRFCAVREQRITGR